jgi:hypothetical protein
MQEFRQLNCVEEKGKTGKLDSCGILICHASLD